MSKQFIGAIGSKFIGSSPYADMSWSGSSKRFFQSCKKHDLLMEAVGCDVPPHFKIPLILKNFSCDKQVWKLKFRLDTDYYDCLTRGLAKKINALKYDADIIQLGGIYNLPSIFKKTRRCFSYHDGNLIQLLKSPFMPGGISWIKIEKALQYEKDVYQGMDKIFTMSNYLRQSFIKDFGIEASRVCCIGAGINIDDIPEDRQKNYENKNIVFIGINFQRKGGPLLVKSFRTVRKKYPKALLHIIGPENPAIDKKYLDGIILHGFLSRPNKDQQNEFIKVMNEASLFVMPSLYEPFGIAPLEAMVYKIPCILPDKWAFPDMVTPGVEGELLKGNKAEELAEKIICLLADPDLLETMGKAARAKVLAQFTWDKVVTRLIREL